MKRPPLRPEHCWKEPSPILVREEGSSICPGALKLKSAEHALKASSPMLVTSGKSTVTRLEQPSYACAPRLVSSDMFRLVRLPHSKKA